MTGGDPEGFALILRHFPGLSTRQQEQYRALDALYREWNSRINVISRRDIDHLYLHHVLHSLAIARLVTFDPGDTVLDIGTGGGFPGIPLAILFPGARFVLVDSIGKKIRVVGEVSTALGLDNVSTHLGRAEAMDGKFDYAVCRAVTRLDTLAGWMVGKIRPGRRQAVEHGLLALKGGDLSGETAGLRVREYPLSGWFPEAFFETKKLVHIPLG
jgi:16S rRNA (guanine527-N7)-methyltransferase